MTASARKPVPDQPDMFGHSTPQPRPERAPRPEFTPFPHSVIKRLNADIRWLYPAEWLPWSEEETDRRERDFIARVARLRPEDRGDLVERYQVELARLRAAPRP